MTAPASEGAMFSPHGTNMDCATAESRLAAYLASITTLRTRLEAAERERDEAVEAERQRVFDMFVTDLRTLTGITWSPTSGVTLEVLLTRYAEQRHATLRAERDRLATRVDYLEMDRRTRVDHLDAERARAAALAAALRRYGRHDDTLTGYPQTCPALYRHDTNQGYPCTCGLDAALRPDSA